MKQILFNTEMVRAILDGRKTVTRRVVNYKHLRGLENLTAKKIQRACVAPHQIGDILYVRETWRIVEALENLSIRVEYAADGKISNAISFTADRMQKVLKFLHKKGWLPNIFMPREAARIFLRVTDVRVERLQTSFFEPICPIFAVQAEGIDIGDTCRECIENYGEPCCVDTVDEDGSDLYGGECGELDQSRGEFSDLWDSTIKPAERERYGWAANPWVWVIEFERCDKPEEG